VETFFNSTWFVWWLLAVGAIVRWYWVKLGPGAHNNDNDADRRQWKELYRMAVQERDPRKLLSRIETANAAILTRMNQRPDENAVEQNALEDARKNLAALQESADLAAPRHDLGYTKQPIAGHRGWRLVGSSKNRNSNMRRV
jgi:hypothetical protein